MQSVEATEIVGADRIARFADETWPARFGTTHAYMRYYIVPFEPEDGFDMPGFNGDEVIFGGVPFKVVVANIVQKEYVTAIPWIVRLVEGKQQIWSERLDRVLPPAVYVVISTPMRSDVDIPKAFSSASVAADEFVGLMRAYGGSNLFRQKAYECATTLDDVGREIGKSEFVPFIQSFDGPFATSEVWQAFGEIDAAIASCNHLLRNRVLRATQLVEQGAAVEPGLKFFSYWVALEVAVGDHSFHKILRVLSKAYDQKKNAYVQNDLGFQVLYGIRTNVFHDGETYEMTFVVERYFQQLVLDVVRAVLGLPCNRYMERAVKQWFDVRWLRESAGVVLNIVEVPSAPV